MPAYFKVCPRCGQTAELGAARCRSCGHVYRTVFTEPSDRTTAVSAPWSGGKLSRPVLVRLGVAVAVAILLAVTNPNEEDLAAWAIAQTTPAQATPQTAMEAAGTAIGYALLPSLVRGLVGRWNFGLFSIFRPRQGGGRILVGACGCFWPIPPLPGAPETGPDPLGEAAARRERPVMDPLSTPGPSISVGSEAPPVIRSAPAPPAGAPVVVQPLPPPVLYGGGPRSRAAASQARMEWEVQEQARRAGRGMPPRPDCLLPCGHPETGWVRFNKRPAVHSCAQGHSYVARPDGSWQVFCP
jgi:hypothetical protein